MNECIICGKTFTPWHSRQKCCSKKCSKIRRKQTKKIYYVSDKGKLTNRNYQLKSKRKVWIKKYKQSNKYKDYLKSEKYKLWVYNYNRSLSRKESAKTFLHSKKRKIWLSTLIGKLNVLKSRIKRRAIKNNYIETYTEKEWQDKLEATKGMCPGYKVNPHYIGIDKLTRDHDYSITKASKDYLKTGIKRIYTIKNMNPLCSNCNSRKGNR